MGSLSFCVPSSRNAAFRLSSFCIHAPILVHTYRRGGDIDNVVFIDESTWGSCVLLLPLVSFSYTRYRYVKRNKLQIIHTIYNIIPSIWYYTYFSYNTNTSEKSKHLRLVPLDILSDSDDFEGYSKVIPRQVEDSKELS